MRKLTLFAIILGIALSCTVTANLMAQSVETYESLMKSGNEKFVAQDYISAKTYFEMALKQKANDATAKKRLNETLAKIGEENEKQEVFYAHMDKGDAFYNQKKYDEALAEYNKSLSIFPNDKYVTSQTDAIHKILQDRQSKSDDFNLAMAQGAALMETQNYDAAILKFQEASQILPNDDQPKLKIAEATRLNKAYNDNVNQFNKLTKEANELSARKNYEAAIAKLNQALAIFPNDNDVKAQIAALSSSKSQSGQYNSLIAEADKLYENKLYKDSKIKYQAALAVAPNDAYASDMIQRINQVFDSPEYLAQENYLKAIEKAKALEDQSQIAMALSAFQEALKYKPDDVFATEKVTELTEYFNNQALRSQTGLQFGEIIAKAEQAEKNNDLNNALLLYIDASELKPNDEAVKKKVDEIQTIIHNAEEADKLYAQSVAEADKLFNSQSYESAITEYRNALTIRPKESYPQKQIAEAQKAIKNLADALKAIDDRYNAAIADADKLFNSKSYQISISAYQNALNIKPKETYPQQQIEAAKKAMEKIAAVEQKAIDDRYKTTIADADKLFKNKSYKNSKGKYQEALTIVPNDAYANNMITRINQLLESPEYIAQENYQDAVDRAKALEDLSQTAMALSAFQEALSYKPDDVFAAQKVAELTEYFNNQALRSQTGQQFSELLAKAQQAEKNNQLSDALNYYIDASELKPENETIRKKVVELQTILQRAEEIDRLYAQQIEEADKQFNSQHFESSITSYRNALTIKPNETYPQQQIKAAQKAIDVSYNAAIAEADKLFKSQNYESSITSYRNALSFKPNEIYPQKQIEAAENNIKNLADAAERQKRINKLLAIGDEYFVGKDYLASKDVYLEVTSIDAKNATANARIKEIDNILAQLAQNRQQNYEAAMKAGGQFMSEQNYIEAIRQYNIALDNKENDALASSQLSLAKKYEADRIAALTAKYNAYIKEADGYFKDKEYDKAIVPYTQAQDLGLGIKYPSEMIAQINQILKEHLLLELNDAPIILPAGKSKRFSFKPIDYAKRRDSYIILKVRNVDHTKSFPMIVSFGNQAKQNGGFAVPISNDEEYKTYIIKVSSIYTWFSEDNIWIEMIAEKGDVEIDMVDISRGN